MRRAVLTAMAAHTPEELQHMHHLARFTASERGRLVDEFLDAAFAED